MTNTSSDPRLSETAVSKLVTAFVVLGVGLRLARYAMNYPLWWDEAFVGVNLLNRGYVDLLRPLDYAQVCPLLFLWIELTVVKLVGFSEWSLRLFPLLCSVASVPLFSHLAKRVVSGVPLVLAVAIFAVAYHPIRHAADVKPYASDLLVALGLLAMVVEWRRDGRTRWLWILTASVPFAIALSHPAVFVAGGIGLAIGLPVWRSRDRAVFAAYASFLLITAGSFLWIYLMFTRAQASATLAGMSAQWASGFPPLTNPLALAFWLARVHTGSMFAYPCGGERGASVATFTAFVTGGILLWKRDRVLVAALIGPFTLALVAAALGRYPYGGVTHGSPARIMQFLAPAICLLAGIGLAKVLAIRPRAVRIGLMTLVVIGIAPLIAESTHPYRSIQAARARDFARTFWPALAREGEPVCLRWDLGVGVWDSTDLNVAVYLCNQKIYSPVRDLGPRWDKVSESRPLLCVESLARANDPEVKAWLEAMSTHYRMIDRLPIEVHTAETGARRKVERYVVYNFVPRLSSTTSSKREPATHTR